MKTNYFAALLTTAKVNCDKIRLYSRFYTRLRPPPSPPPPPLLYHTPNTYLTVSMTDLKHIYFKNYNEC